MLTDEAERRKCPFKTVYVGAATGESPSSAVASRETQNSETPCWKKAGVGPGTLLRWTNLKRKLFLSIIPQHITNNHMFKSEEKTINYLSFLKSDWEEPGKLVWNLVSTTKLKFSFPGTEGNLSGSEPFTLKWNHLLVIPTYCTLQSPQSFFSVLNMDRQHKGHMTSEQSFYMKE